MTATIQIRRHSSGSALVPPSLMAGEPAYDAIGDVLYIGRGDNGAGVATSIKAIGGAGAFLLQILVGAANGVASLDGSGKIPTGQLPASILGALNYQGTWNATTNQPAIVSGSGNKGYFYKVATAGSVVIDGINAWNVGDMIAFDGTTWDKIDGENTEVSSVAGQTGAVILHASDLTDSTSFGRALLTAGSAKAQRLALTLDSLTLVADANKVQGAADLNIQYSSMTAARGVTLASAASFNPGEIFWVGDMSGQCSSTNTITLTRAGSDMINGQSSVSFGIAYGQMSLQSDGVSKFTIMTQPAGAQSSIDGGTF